MTDREQELKIGVSGLCERLGIKGHLLLYLANDSERVNFTGDLSLSVLVPILLAYLTKGKNK